jgi:arginase family enzyme
MAFAQDDLEALRHQFGASDGGTMATPEYRRIAEKIFSEGGRRPAPYAGMPTLLDAPARSLSEDAAELAGLQVALYGVPMDLAVTNRNGSRFGPRALRAIERIGPYNDALGCAPVHEMAVADVGDVPFRSRFDLRQSHEDTEAHVSRIVDAGVIPIGVGGDHSVTHPILRAIGRDRPVGMIHIDAHCDTGGPYEGERFHHGGPFRNADRTSELKAELRTGLVGGPVGVEGRPREKDSAGGLQTQAISRAPAEHQIDAVAKMRAIAIRLGLEGSIA